MDKPITATERRAVKSLSTKISDLIIAFICFLLILVCLLPILYIAAVSLSDTRAVVNGQVLFWPVDATLISYKYVFNDPSFSRSLLLTAQLTVVQTSLAMFMTVICAYPLSKRYFIGKRVFNTLIIVTMYFSAGMIPNYILYKSLGLYDTFWVMVLPGCLSVFNTIILKSSFFTIPESLRESAEIDGANQLTILVRIYLPLSTAVLATLTLFYAVGRWNGFADARMFVSTSSLYPIQFKLYQIINNFSSIDQAEGNMSQPVASESMKSAAVMFAMLPILMVYPFLQKYFIAGVTVGAIKG